jgi:hypothetical protein
VINFLEDQLDLDDYVGEYAKLAKAISDYLQIVNHVERVRDARHRLASRLNEDIGERINRREQREQDERVFEAQTGAETRSENVPRGILNEWLQKNSELQQSRLNVNRFFWYAVDASVLACILRWAWRLIPFWGLRIASIITIAAAIMFCGFFVVGFVLYLWQKGNYTNWRKTQNARYSLETDLLPHYEQGNAIEFNLRLIGRLYIDYPQAIGGQLASLIRQIRNVENNRNIL